MCAVCEVLRLINTDYVITQLVQAANQHPNDRSWLIAALGQLQPDAVRAALQGNPLLSQIQPFFNLSIQENWLRTDEKVSDLKFLVAQNIV